MKRMRRRKLSQTKFLHFHDLEPSCSFSFFTSYLLSIALLFFIIYHLICSILARGFSAKDKKAGAGRQFSTNARCTNAIEYSGKVLTLNRQ
jgi:hypothetical protein